jgi:uncharacterized protein YqhQ
MMRGLQQATVAVRAPDGSIARRTVWARLPLLRGIQMLGDALIIGVWALSYSANVASGEDDKPLTPQDMSLLLATSLLMAIGLFFVLPLVLASLLARLGLPPVMRELLEGVLRMAIFVGYLLLIRRSSEIRRVFAYHGAEHKTVNAYEAGAPLTPDSVKAFSLIHPRCGTSFVLVVLIISIIIFSLLGDLPFLLRLLSRILFVPIIAGIGYELLRLSARHYHRGWVRALVAPTLAMQKLTTEEPDESMLEVAILALRRVLLSDGVALDHNALPVEEILDPQPTTV